MALTIDYEQSEALAPIRGTFDSISQWRKFKERERQAGRRVTFYQIVHDTDARPPEHATCRRCGALCPHCKEET